MVVCEFKLRLKDHTFSSDILLDEYVLLFSRLSQLCIKMVFHSPMFGQTLFANLATERFVWQARYLIV